MNRISWVKRITVFVVFLTIGLASMACEISFKVSEKYQKEVYAVGDEVVVEQKVILIHRNCHVAIDDTKTTATGCEILGATKWTEASPGVYERKLKVKISGGKESEIKISCNRSCDKDGGYGKIILKKKV